MSNKQAEEQKIDTALIAYTESLAASAQEWAAYALGLIINNGPIEEMTLALQTVSAQLTELRTHHELSAQVVSGIQESLKTAVEQRDKLALDREVVNATFDKQSKVAATEMLEFYLSDEEAFDEVAAEELANRMMDEDAATIEQDARETLERRLAIAKEWVNEWRGEGQTTGPGLFDAFTLTPDPNFRAPSGFDDDDLDLDDDEGEDSEDEDDDEGEDFDSDTLIAEENDFDSAA